MRASERGKVLLVINDSRRGGGQKNVLQLAEYLSSTYSVGLACPRGPLLDRARLGGYETFEIGTGFRCIWQIRRAVQSFNPSVVHTHLLGTSFYTVIGSMGTGVKLITTLHNPVLYSGISYRRKLAYPFALRCVCLRATVCIAVSEEIRKEVNAIVGKNIAVHIANTVKVPEPRSSVVTFKAQGPLTLVVVGALTDAKGHPYLLQAVAQLKRSMDVRLLVVGSGPRLAKLQLMVEELNLQGEVQFVGEVDDVASALENTDIVVVPSVFEGTPYVLLEAMALGKPIVATNVGGIPRVIRSGDNGILVPPMNAEAIVMAINTLARDETLRKNIAVNARRTVVADFDHQRTMKAYARAYAAVIDEGR